MRQLWSEKTPMRSKSASGWQVMRHQKHKSQNARNALRYQEVVDLLSAVVQVLEMVLTACKRGEIRVRQPLYSHWRQYRVSIRSHVYVSDCTFGRRQSLCLQDSHRGLGKCE